ncbi:unnamed protein product [Bursaphelenchus xylophilus]|uniref:(pine wood nematode) hypothetical protein n=1 Tax=Bursaphelenchus xylophilus TaxID=6326 RepID=A0A1I7RW95_BURXY|nr:unnamed protein product [Bursaphelenchus xylophilus]CAG9095317.1 unnamed protein product [Bursaphelenchus xylophilus]
MRHRYDQSSQLLLLSFFFLCHSTFANDSCLNVSSDCCWRENNSSRPWKFHDHIDQTYYRRTFRLGTLRAPPASGYYSSVLSDPHELSALESCDYCTRTGILKISIRHWASPVSAFQLCFRQTTPERKTSQCKELDSNKHGLVETQTIRVLQGYPVNIIIVLRSRSVHLPPTGLIDFLDVETEPCDVNIKPLRKDVKPRFYEHEDGMDEEGAPRQKQAGIAPRIERIPTSRQGNSEPDHYQELLSKKRSYYDKLLEKQLMRKEFKSHQLAAPRVVVGDKPRNISRLITTSSTSSKPAIPARNPKRILTSGWSKRKNDEALKTTTESSEDVLNKGSTAGTTSTTAKATQFPDPLSEMFGKDFAEFLEPTFNSSRYEKEEDPEDEATVNPINTTVNLPVTAFPPRMTTTEPSAQTGSQNLETESPVEELQGKVITTSENPSTLARLRIQPLNKRIDGTEDTLKEQEVSSSMNPLKVVPAELHSHLPSFSHHFVDVIPPHIHPAHLASIITTTPPAFNILTTMPTTTLTPAIVTTQSSATIRPLSQEPPTAPPVWSTTEDLPEHTQIEEVVLPEFKEKSCDISGGCLFENGLCSFRNMNPSVFRKVTVGTSNFIETRVTPGQVASIESPTNASEPFFVVFDYLEWTEGERFMGCCQFKVNGKSQLRCPFESERAQGEILWRGGMMACVAGTEKIIFICENLGSKHGICALDNVRLHPDWDPGFTEPCQRDSLNQL